jgi:hypothetical protein
MLGWLADENLIAVLDLMSLVTGFIGALFLAHSASR